MPGALNVLDKYVPRAQFVQGDVTDFTAIAGVNQPTNTNTYFARVDHNFSETVSSADLPGTARG